MTIQAYSVVLAHTLPDLEPSIGVLRKLGVEPSEPPDPRGARLRSVSRFIRRLLTRSANAFSEDKFRRSGRQPERSVSSKASRLRLQRRGPKRRSTPRAPSGSGRLHPGRLSTRGTKGAGELTGEQRAKSLPIAGFSAVLRIAEPGNRLRGFESHPRRSNSALGRPAQRRRWASASFMATGPI
jgi:hypothetical protein